MTLRDWIRTRQTIRRVAAQECQTVAAVRASMQEAIDAAWSEAWAPGNIRAQVKWQRLFQGARKPTVEEFILRLGQELKSMPGEQN